MENPKIGDRVFAVEKSIDNKVTAFGGGTYQGDKDLPKELKIACGFKENEIFLNPCILLDSGEEVFGAECWWGPEKEAKEALKGTTVTIITVKDSRELYIRRN